MPNSNECKSIREYEALLQRAREEGSICYLQNIPFDSCLYNNNKGIWLAFAWKLGWIERKFKVTGQLTDAESIFLKILDFKPWSPEYFKSIPDLAYNKDTETLDNP